MTDTAKLFKEVKVVTRSLLLSAPKGLTVRSFVNDYRIHNGQEFPYRELGYGSAIDLLKDLPDAVRMEWLPSIGDYILKGIADATTKHIENLVKKQRSSKSRRPQPPRFQRLYTNDRHRNYNESSSYGRRTVNQSALKRATQHHLAGLVPAKLRGQIRQLLASYEDGLLLTNFRVAFKKHFGTDFPLVNLGFTSLENCLNHIPDSVALKYSDNLLKAYPVKRKDDERRSESMNSMLQETQMRTIDQPKRHEVNGVFEDKSLSQNHMDSLDGFDSSEDTRTKFNIYQGNFISTTQHNALDDTFTVKMKHNRLDSFTSKMQCSTEDDLFASESQPIAVDKFSGVQQNMNENSFISRTHHDRHESFNSRIESEKSDDTRTSITTSDDSTISETMKKDFQRVLEFYSEGLWATEFLDKYSAITRQKLDVTELGYSSLIELVSALPDIFAIRRPNNRKDDWLLFDVNNQNIKRNESNWTKDAVSTSPNPSLSDEEPEISETLKNNILCILKRCYKNIALEEFEKIYKVNFNVDLPWASLGFDSIESFMVVLSGDIPLNLTNVDGKFYIMLQPEIIKPQKSSGPFVDLKSNPANIPNDAALSDCCFQTQTLPEDISKYIEIFVSSVDHPGQIWIQLRGETTTIALEVLMQNLENVYYGNEGENYQMPERFVEVGQVCAVVWPGDDNWHRAIITGIPSREFVEVFYVDYGSKGNVKKSGLNLLKKEFLGLPTQALKARLSHILPAVGKRWSEKSKQVLLNLCCDKPLVALITNTEYEQRLSVCLCDVSAANDFHINDFLVREGYAKPFKDPCGINSSEQNAGGLNLSPMNQIPEDSINKIQSVTDMVTVAAVHVISQLSGSGVNVDALHQLLSSCTLAVHSDSTSPKETVIPQSTSNSPLQNEINSVEEPREIFEEDDDFYEQLCQSAEKLNISIKRICLVGGHIIHIIDSNNKPFVSGGDISSLFGKSVCLEKLLMMMKILIPSVVLEKSNNEEVFQELKRYNVKGIKNETEETARITLYPLNNVMEILDGLSHPSEILRKEIANIIREIDDNNIDDFLQDNDVPEDPHITSQTVPLDKMSMQELVILYEDQCKRRTEILQKMMDPNKIKDYHVEEISCIEKNLIKLDARMKEMEDVRGNEVRNKHKILQEVGATKRDACQQSPTEHNLQNEYGKISVSTKNMHSAANSNTVGNRISSQSISNTSSMNSNETVKDFELFRPDNSDDAIHLHPSKFPLQYSLKNEEYIHTVDVASKASNLSVGNFIECSRATTSEQLVPSSQQASPKNISMTQSKVSPLVPLTPSIRFSSHIFAPKNCSPSPQLLFPVRPTAVQPRYTWNSGKST